MLVLVIASWLLLILFVYMRVDLQKREVEAARKVEQDKEKLAREARVLNPTFAHTHNIEQFADFK
jgi:hypothetical protein